MNSKLESTRDRTKEEVKERKRKEFREDLIDKIKIFLIITLFFSVAIGLCQISSTNIEGLGPGILVTSIVITGILIESFNFIKT